MEEEVRPLKHEEQLKEDAVKDFPAMQLEEGECREDSVENI